MVVCDGDTVLDGCLTAIGDLVEDVVVRHHGIRYGTDSVAWIEHRRGGSAANTAAAAAPLVPARFVGRVGADLTGERLVAALETAGVDVRVQRGGRTGTVVALVDPTGERTMLSDRATAGELEPIDPTWLIGSAIVHVPAYGFGVDTAAAPLVIEAMRAATSQGAQLAIDVSATTLIEEHGVGRFRDLLGTLGPTYVFANADEAALLDLVRHPIPGSTTVAKAGPDPATVVTPDGRCTQVPVPPNGPAADTTGAGDAFAAGFLAAVMRGADAVEACAAGHDAAARLFRALAERT
jgi:sugar/nucleoside kinase (ribokinase family)